jgi:hypothetical protein
MVISCHCAKYLGILKICGVKEFSSPQRGAGIGGRAHGGGPGMPGIRQWGVDVPALVLTYLPRNLREILVKIIRSGLLAVMIVMLAFASAEAGFYAGCQVGQNFPMSSGADNLDFAPAFMIGSQAG